MVNWIRQIQADAYLKSYAELQKLKHTKLKENWPEERKEAEFWKEVQYYSKRNELRRKWFQTCDHTELCKCDKFTWRTNFKSMDN